MIKIFILDDHSVVREGLKRIIEESADMKVVMEAGDGLDALRKLKKADVDLIITDLSVPGVSGVELIKRMKSLKPQLPILVLTIHAEDQFGLRILKTGAAGYLTKESAPRLLLNAIQKVLSGGRYISENLAEQLALQLIDPGKNLHEKLSHREFSILCMFGMGKTVSEVSSELGLSVKTVSTYKARIMQKMNMKSTAQLIRYAIVNHLV
ncbi:MAG: DNA-binding response regulator [Desulfobacteraceae bacterium]|nr:MAG: DNA-binding response regulator [Desulfobacteraceae bacterium]